MLNPPGGKSVNDLTAQYMKKHDKNKDGVIQIPQEQFTTETQYEPTGTTVVRDYFVNGYKREYAEVKKTTTATVLPHADHNKNGLVGKDELKAYIQLFDENGDGVLSETRTDGKDQLSELAKFNAANPETTTKIKGRTYLK